MSKYEDWLEMALKDLNQDFCIGYFKPENEVHLQCHLYHVLSLTELKVDGLQRHHPVVAEFSGILPQKKIDLALCRRFKESLEPRLLIEIKETSKDYLSKTDVENRIEPDIKKLMEYREMLKSKASDVSGNYKRMLRRFRPPAVVFFFRGASKKGISEKLNREMKELEKEIYSEKEIRFYWGPVC